jgi:hypothetical protein
MLFLVALLFLLRCTADSPKGTLQISFQFNPAQRDVEPSYQIAIWLEDADEQYVKTLLLSEYLSYGGYNDTTICSAWNSQADWDNAPMQAYDAVTRATPPVGDNLVAFALDTLELEHGEYFCCVQAHVIEDYNILFKQKMNTRKYAQTTSDPIYDPQAYAGAEDVLANVTTQLVKN